MKRRDISCMWCVTLLVFAVGCLRADYSSAPTAAGGGSKHTADDGHDHGHDHEHVEDEGHSRHQEAGHAHAAGPNGGTIVDWGRGTYHLEFTVDHQKQQAVVYAYGTDEKTPKAIQPADGKILLTIQEPSFQLELAADPREGDAEGASSRFVGVHEKLGEERGFAGTLSAQVDGVPYAGDFHEAAHDETSKKK
ncbi:MAG: hypothetical protein U1A77_14965 [Pirellulales bacterium]